MPAISLHCIGTVGAVIVLLVCTLAAAAFACGLVKNAKARRHDIGAALVFGTLLLLALFIGVPRACHAADISSACMRHRVELIRHARQIWGMTAPVSTFVAQLHQESGCNSNAVSPVGARSMAQVMPGTEKDLRSRYVDLRELEVTNPTWAMRALLLYDRELYQRTTAVDECNRMAKTLAKYNGGEAWIIRQERKAGSQGMDARIYFDQVELVNAGRSVAATKENRGYPRRILFVLEPR
jgi:soluble lytic murein transglycosylase-like protein